MGEAASPKHNSQVWGVEDFLRVAGAETVEKGREEYINFREVGTEVCLFGVCQGFQI